MAEKMTICDAVDAYEFYDLFSDILDTYERDFATWELVDSDLRDLIEEHDEIYEFVPDAMGSYLESFERNLKEALVVIRDVHGTGIGFEEDFTNEAMDDDEIAGIYNDGLEPGPINGRDPMGGFDDDSDYS